MTDIDTERYEIIRDAIRNYGIKVDDIDLEWPTPDPRKPKRLVRQHVMYRGRDGNLKLRYIKLMHDGRQVRSYSRAHSRIIQRAVQAKGGATHRETSSSLDWEKELDFALFTITGEWTPHTVYDLPQRIP